MSRIVILLLVVATTLSADELVVFGTPVPAVTSSVDAKRKVMDSGQQLELQLLLTPDQGGYVWKNCKQQRLPMNQVGVVTYFYRYLITPVSTD